MKYCSKCKTNKPFDAFAKNKGRYDGLQSYCKECKRLVDKKYHADNAEDIRPRKSINARKYKYGLTADAYNDLLHQQENLCACCGEAPPKSVDHDHSCCPGAKTCGKCVRGLLCQKCNLFIGFLETNPNLLEKANNYIKLSSIV